MDKNNVKKKFVGFVIFIVSLVIVVLLSTYLLDTTGKINQGTFRVSDLVLVSTVDIQDRLIENEEADSAISLSDLRLDLSQKNRISFMIAKSSETDISEIFINNVKINYPILTESIYIYQDEDNKIDLTNDKVNLDLKAELKDNQYTFDFNIDNINFVKDAIIPETETAVVYDGTILNILNINMSDVKFSITFDLNVIDLVGRKNICKVNLKLPNELLANNGISIIKENPGDFPFRIK